MNNLNMKGKGKVSGGTYEEAKIEGIATIEGDLKCDILEMDGICSFEGNVCAKVNVDIDGICNIEGNLDTEGLIHDGVLIVAGNITAENAVLDGVISLKGTMNVGTLDMKLHTAIKAIGIGISALDQDNMNKGSSVIKEVVGGKIYIHHTRGKGYLMAELIEGDDINIEKCKVKVVRGDNITIGKGCEVDTAKYRSSLNIHPKADVKEKIKLD